jgi:hypothetical protein
MHIERSHVFERRIRPLALSLQPQPPHGLLVRGAPAAAPSQPIAGFRDAALLVLTLLLVVRGRVAQGGGYWIDNGFEQPHQSRELRLGQAGSQSIRERVRGRSSRIFSSGYSVWPAGFSGRNFDGHSPAKYICPVETTTYADPARIPH